MTKPSKVTVSADQPARTNRAAIRSNGGSIIGLIRASKMPKSSLDR
jgi:hypothetical protein